MCGRAQTVPRASAGTLSSGMRRVALLALCACDRVLGLGSVVAADAFDSHAPFFDTRADVACPPIGMTPSYGLHLNEVVEQPCFFYSTSTIGTALAECFDATGNRLTATGRIDEPLSPAIGFADGTVAFETVAISPEGDFPVAAVSGGAPPPPPRTCALP